MTVRYPTPQLDALSQEREKRAAPLVVRAIEELKDTELCCAADETAYARFMVGDHKETWRIRSREFRAHIQRRARQTLGAILTKPQLQEVLEHFENEAALGDVIRGVHVRSAYMDGKIYIDTGDKNWSVIEVGPDGVKVIPSSSAPVTFVRARGTQALPAPDFTGTLEELRALAQIPDNHTWRLLVGAIIAAFTPGGPYFISIICGGHGSGKSVLLRWIRALIDPVLWPTRSPPRGAEDLWITARSEYAPCYDNVSHFGWLLADEFCRLATGGGASVREHYTHDEAFLYGAKRPCFMTAIHHPSDREDFLSRALIIELPPRRESLPERILEARFAQMMEAVGQLQDTVSKQAEEIERLRNR